MERCLGDLAGLGRLDEVADRLRGACSEVGKRHAVDVSPCALRPGDELAVGDVMQTRCGVDADDPEAAEVALLAMTCDVREVAGAIGGLFGGAVELPLVEEIPAREL